MTNPLTARITAQGRALELLAERQKVLAGNIANADTPGFQARDFDFAQALAQARAGAGAEAVVRTAAAHLSSAGTPADATPTVQLQWRTPEQPALDGNTVDLDRERAHFADNAVRYEATLRFINHDVRTLLSAITGQ
ncbi:flagellar basal body rod protein FlgB [Ramlibacter alkalitolerans]|jgi:flagellar basal-body rod protein FlgB|uniref:Flagellar basal body rod protein FlgB n=1 Tax=Ramlibacter alkalitolerans TaxID=2039631 RepID=A0ABS1JLS6_9BURK|nr:flagellar basal body rod protein FlgB [Ramlibacter alkalitolerans]MBL0424861.1 flagellar basal body rod protein FlgB [Ramlibacter alkalitolerans]